MSKGLTLVLSLVLSLVGEHMQLRVLHTHALNRQVSVFVLLLLPLFGIAVVWCCWCFGVHASLPASCIAALARQSTLVLYFDTVSILHAGWVSGPRPLSCKLCFHDRQPLCICSVWMCSMSPLS